MGQHDCDAEQSHHHHHGTSDHCHDHHDRSPVKALPLSARERLIIRIEHTVQHNHEHADFYGELADAAVKVGGEKAARQVRTAIACITRQNEHLKKALAYLKSP